MTRPSEETYVHTRLLKCALEVEDARAYWRIPVAERSDATPRKAFESYWFGARSLGRTKVLLVNLRARFDAFPVSAEVLHGWQDMDPETRRTLCHWHLQLSDPLYRSFTGEYLVQRRESGQTTVSRDLVVGWVGQQGPGRWTMTTRIQFASKLLSAAYSAGLLGGNRDPRAIVFPRIPEEAIAYLLYLLREVEFEGTLLQNPYVASVFPEGRLPEDRLRSVPGLTFRRQGDLVDFGWLHKDLLEWARAHVCHNVDALGGRQ